MNKIKYIIGLCFITVFISCSSECTDHIEATNITPFETPTQQEFEQLQQDVLDDKTEIIQLDIANGVNYTSPSGVTVFIAPTCLNINGVPVTGFIDFEFTEIFDRGDMLTSNITTVGAKLSGEKEYLISGGAFYISATQNGQIINMTCPGSIGVPTLPTGGADQEMRPFGGSIGVDGNIDWAIIDGEIEIGADLYFGQFPGFGWFNIDRFANDPRLTTQLQVAIPQEFNTENTRVYIAIEGEPNSLSYVYGAFPIGLAAHIIFISEENGNFRYAIKSLTIEENQIVAFARQQTQIASASELQSIVNALP